MAMVTRYSIQDEVGRFLTIAGSFAYDDEDAAEFWDEDEAIAELAAYPGCTVETYQRLSDFPDFTATPSIEKEAA
ncbi:hypothetical protein JVX98_13040 [Ensifer sp. PDNC004]|uniref:hypothetical protein n=1 Tax=Ensifer sp. PDNC004 TaxID=2811423 RepID=UPI0019646CB5|nr:hypothetical protein [Ensifer sp. PDNC004]QRY69143.1 hypothetical protein JVX98_13040 [Ensifer sp. PDNC004]